MGFNTGDCVFIRRDNSFFTGIASLLTLFVSLNSTVYSQELLIPYRVKDKWGYADLDGKIKIHPGFGYAGFFRNGYVQIYRETGIGLVNAKGVIVIPAIYSRVETGGRTDPATGRTTLTHAVVTTKDYKQGIHALPSGKLLVDTVYQEVYNQWGDLIIVRNGYGKQGVYSIKLKKWIAEPVHQFAQPMGDTLVVIDDAASGYRAIPVHANGVGRLRPYEWPSVPLVEATIARATDGSNTAPVREQNPELSPEERYQRQLLIKDGKYGFAFVHAPYKGDTIPPMYDKITRASEYAGRLGVKSGDKWGIVDSKNNVILPIQYEGVEAHNSMPENNIFVIRENGGRSILHKSSGKILASGYDEVRLERYFYLLRKGNLWGILFLQNIHAPVLIEPEFTKVDTRTEEFKLKNGEEIFFLQVWSAHPGGASGYISSKGKKYYID